MSDDSKKEIVELGDRVVDTVTNFKGVVVAYSIQMHNCDRAQIQCAEFHEGQPVQPIWFDVPRLEVVDKAVVKVIPANQSSPIKLGDEVKDSISGFSGIADSRGVWITGCVRFGVAPTKTKKEGDMIDDLFFPDTQLVIVKAAKPAVVPKEKPGGPGKDTKFCRKDPHF